MNQRQMILLCKILNYSLLCNGDYVFETESPVALELEKMGYVEKSSAVVKANSEDPETPETEAMTIEGWKITEAGRLAYQSQLSTGSKK